MVIEALWAIQDEFGYISGDRLVELSARLKVPVSDLHGVVSYYPHFRLAPPPKTSVHVCRDLLCAYRGAAALREGVEKLFEGAAPVEVKGCSCVGQCDRGPAALIDDHPVAPGDVNDMLALVRRAIAGENVDRHAPSPAHARRRSQADPYATEEERYGTLRAIISEGTPGANVVAKIDAAHLRGMGGTGRAAAKDKWIPMLALPRGEKYVVCNADESEVGNFKDREILLDSAHLVIEGMAIAGVALGAEAGYIYIRHEYHDQIGVLKHALADARARTAIGSNLFGSGKRFDLKLFVSPGGYIMGEQTALLEAIEGKRGEPRNQKADVGLERSLPHLRGLFDKPTLVHNVETLAYVPVIVAKGPEWWHAQGVNGASGLKRIGVCGDVTNPGVFEVPMGSTYAELIALAGGIIGGRKLKAISPSGPTGGFYPADHVNECIDFVEKGRGGSKGPTPPRCAVGSAAVMVLAEGRCLVDAAWSLTRFYRNESCGKCIPCRLGSQKLVDVLDGVSSGTATRAQIESIAPLGRTMRLASICGLGKVVDVPIASVRKHFPEEYEDHVIRRTCRAGVCFGGTAAGART
jgi:NADH:ubiquinone oxidoreductase subunit F (NADH-binding)/NADH:ubiquinone oxidoreductase subunit E